jgi:hypothetical protein
VGSNPTPRASLRVLSQNNKSERAKNALAENNLPEAIINTALKLDIRSCNDHNLENECLHDKINSITENCSKSYFRKILTNLATANPKNASVICDYLTSEETEFNIKASTKQGKIKTLVWLSNHFDDKVHFKEMSKEHLLSYLNKGKKSFEQDKSQRWIGTYNGRQMILLKFFKWMCNSNEPPSERRETPTCMAGIKQLRRQDKVRYKPSDMWYPKEHTIFLKYCPSIIRSGFVLRNYSYFFTYLVILSSDRLQIQLKDRLPSVFLET